MPKPVPYGFFSKPTTEVAKKLLGSVLVHNSPEGKTSGRIVETEAYLYNDPSCHGFRGETPRNRAMFGPPGHAYIYFVYGMYYCFNVVTAPSGVGEAVLIRALEPVEGIWLMEKRRREAGKCPKKLDVASLTNGPGKLVIAMGMTREMNGASLISSRLKILPADSLSPVPKKMPIVTTTRIGISTGNHLPLRFYIKGNPFVSKR